LERRAGDITKRKARSLPLLLAVKPIFNSADY